MEKKKKVGTTGCVSCCDKYSTTQHATQLWQFADRGGIEYLRVRGSTAVPLGKPVTNKCQNQTLGLTQPSVPSSRICPILALYRALLINQFPGRVCVTCHSSDVIIPHEESSRVSTPDPTRHFDRRISLLEPQTRPTLARASPTHSWRLVCARHPQGPPRLLQFQFYACQPPRFVCGLCWLLLRMKHDSFSADLLAG